LIVPLIASAAQTWWIKVEWDTNFESDLVGYRVYQTTIPGQYVRVVDDINTPYLVEEVGTGTLTITVRGLADGIYYWVVTAFDNEGLESGYNNELRFQLGSNGGNGGGDGGGCFIGALLI